MKIIECNCINFSRLLSSEYTETEKSLLDCNFLDVVDLMDSMITAGLISKYTEDHNRGIVFTVVVGAVLTGEVFSFYGLPSPLIANSEVTIHNYPTDETVLEIRTMESTEAVTYLKNTVISLPIASRGISHSESFSAGKGFKCVTGEPKLEILFEIYDVTGERIVTKDNVGPTSRLGLAIEFDADYFRKNC